MRRIVALAESVSDADEKRAVLPCPLYVLDVDSNHASIRLTCHAFASLDISPDTLRAVLRLKLAIDEVRLDLTALVLDTYGEASCSYFRLMAFQGPANDRQNCDVRH